MPKEYRTIQEVAGPLMLVRGVEDVAFDELGEIELADGETRRCRVLEIDGSNALVQLFESSTGINLSNSKVRSWDGAWSLVYPAICWVVFLTDWDVPLMTARRSFRRKEEISTDFP